MCKANKVVLQPETEKYPDLGNVMQSNNESPAIRFIAKSIEFKWLPLPLLKWLPLQPSFHSLNIAANILLLASTNNLKCKIAPILKVNQILLANEDFTIRGNFIISEQTIQHIWDEWKTLVFTIDPRVKIVKMRKNSIVLSSSEMSAIKRLLSEFCRINYLELQKHET